MVNDNCGCTCLNECLTDAILQWHCIIAGLTKSRDVIRWNSIVCMNYTISQQILGYMSDLSINFERPTYETTCIQYFIHFRSRLAHIIGFDVLFGVHIQRHNSLLLIIIIIIHINTPTYRNLLDGGICSLTLVNSIFHRNAVWSHQCEPTHASVSLSCVFILQRLNVGIYEVFCIQLQK